MTSASSSAKPPEGTPPAPAAAAPTIAAEVAPGNGHREAIAGLPFRQLPAPTADVHGDAL